VFSVTSAACSARTASCTAGSSTRRLMRKLEVPTPRTAMPAAERAPSARPRLPKVALMPAPMADTAPSPSRQTKASPKRRLASSRRAPTSCTFSSGITTVDQGAAAPASKASCLAGTARSASRATKRARTPSSPRTAAATRPVSLATPTTRPGMRGGNFRTTVSPGPEWVARA
jgi:hypothetical protein